MDTEGSSAKKAEGGEENEDDDGTSKARELFQVFKKARSVVMSLSVSVCLCGILCDGNGSPRQWRCDGPVRVDPAAGGIVGYGAGASGDKVQGPGGGYQQDSAPCGAQGQSPHCGWRAVQGH